MQFPCHYEVTECLREKLFYGQFSGMVEPIAAVIGAVAVAFIEPMLPYALSFAAGAMILL